MTLLSITQVCQRLSVSRSTVYRLISSGELPTHRIGFRLRVSEADLADYITKTRRPDVRVLAANRLLTR